MNTYKLNSLDIDVKDLHELLNFISSAKDISKMCILNIFNGRSILDCMHSE